MLYCNLDGAMVFIDGLAKRLREPTKIGASTALRSKCLLFLFIVNDPFFGAKQPVTLAVGIRKVDDCEAPKLLLSTAFDTS